MTRKKWRNSCKKNYYHFFVLQYVCYIKTNKHTEVSNLVRKLSK